MFRYVLYGLTVRRSAGVTVPPSCPRAYSTVESIWSGMPRASRLVMTRATGPRFLARTPSFSTMEAMVTTW